jgi:hypothetical protein
VKESYPDHKKFSEELRYAKDLHEKSKFNIFLMLSFTLTGLGMVIGTFINDKSSNPLEITYYLTAAAFCIYNTYLAFIIQRDHPFPENPVHKDLVDFQINHIKDGLQRIQNYFFLGITPVYIGILGIISLEFNVGDVLEISKTIWLKFSLVQLLYAICLGRALYLRFYFKNLAKRFSL